MKNVALVSPVLAEFGWIVFDIQSKVRYFFEQHKDCHKVIFANPALKELFELADEIIPVELPENYTPCGRGAEEESGCNNSVFYEGLWATSYDKYKPTEFLPIPYSNRFGNWGVGETHRKFYKSRIVEDEEYFTISCRSLNRGKVKNWSKEKYQELVDWIISEYNLPVYLVGLTKDNFVPDGVVVPETKDVADHISLLSHSKLHFGGNTGTSHLATMCDCPLFSWGEGFDLLLRMASETNPHNTPVELIYQESWDPSVDLIKTKLYNFIDTIKIL